MQHATIDELDRLRSEKDAQDWLLDERLRRIPEGIIRFAVAGILGDLHVDRQSLTAYTHKPSAVYIVDQVVIDMSTYANETYLSKVAGAIEKVLKREATTFTISEPDHKGRVTLEYVP